MPRTYQLGGQTFLTKKAVAEKCKELLYRYEPGEPVGPEEFAFLKDLLALHPKAAEKAGAGIAAFYTVQQPYSKCFFVKRVDNSEVDFSFNKCLK